MPFLASSLGVQATYPSWRLVLEVRGRRATILSRRLIDELGLSSGGNHWAFAGVGLMVAGHHHLVPLYYNDLLLGLMCIWAERRDLLTPPRCVQYPWLLTGRLLLDGRNFDSDACLAVELPPRGRDRLAVSLADEAILRL